MPQITKRKKVFLLADIVLLILLVFFDQFTKYLAVKFLKGKENIYLLKDILELQYLENNGAAFGVLQNQKAFFILIAILILAVIAYVLFLIPDDKKYNIVHILLISISAGAVGNMIDRLKGTYVVDFIYFKIINFPIFNVADIYITVATFVFAFMICFYYKEKDFEFLSFKQQKKIRDIK